MSNGLAIASVTRVLQDLLHSGLTAANIGAGIGGTITVSALPPDRVRPESAAAETTQLNLFLHQVSPNTAWSNTDLPTRDSRNGLVADSLLALNLGYLLSAYTAEELQGEIMLGYAMQLLHENAILTRATVHSILGNPGSAPPAAWAALVGSDLADQVELIKIRPQPLGTDDISKLWTAFQTHYRTTAAYEVSVVLVEKRKPKRTPLPVLSRGTVDPGAQRDAGVAVQPSLAPSVPTLFAATPPAQQPAARLGETVRLDGVLLAGSPVQVLLREDRSGATNALTPAAIADGFADLALPPDPPAVAPPPGSPLDPASWRAGLYRVSLRTTGGDRVARETNALPLVLAPRIRAVSAAAATGGAVVLSVTVSPPVRAGQAVALVVGDQEVPADAFAGASTASLTFHAIGLPAGVTLPVRLRVDGVESLLIDRSTQPPRFDPTQLVALP